MMLSKQALGRIAVSSIIGVLGFVVLNRACGQIPDVVVWWLIYAIGSGVVLNTERGEPVAVLGKMAVLPALVPVLVLGFLVLAEQNTCLSFPNPRIALLLPVASWAGIFAFSFARAPLGQLVELVMGPGAEEKARRAVTVIQLLIAGIAGIALALSSLGGR